MDNENIGSPETGKKTKTTKSKSKKKAIGF
jgi:hypothetical protein